MVPNHTKSMPLKLHVELLDGGGGNLMQPAGRFEQFAGAGAVGGAY
jgi:hypothetical protein